MTNKSWLYGLIVFLAQTCNPHYNQSSWDRKDYSQGEIIEIPDEAFEIEEDFEMRPPKDTESESRIGPRNEDVYQVVENMPRFPGCEQKAIGKNELAKCGEEKMLRFIYENIKYPKVARENGIEGKAIIRFVVDKKGFVKDAKILRNPGGGTGEEALRVVRNMPRWIPGRQRGKPVNVEFTMPVAFKFDDDEVVAQIPPPPPPPPVIEERLFVVVEDMPRFPGCEGQGLAKRELHKCAEEKMFDFIYGNLKYPEDAKKDGLEGRVVLKFYVDLDGTIRNINVLRDPSGSFGKEAIRIMELMNEMPEKWIPGKQRGKPVKVNFTLPISFKL